MSRCARVWCLRSLVHDLTCTIMVLSFETKSKRHSFLPMTTLSGLNCCPNSASSTIFTAASAFCHMFMTYPHRGAIPKRTEYPPHARYTHPHYHPRAASPGSYRVTPATPSKALSALTIPSSLCSETTAAWIASRAERWECCPKIRMAL